MKLNPRQYQMFLQGINSNVQRGRNEVQRLQVVQERLERCIKIQKILTQNPDGNIIIPDDMKADFQEYMDTLPHGFIKEIDMA